MLASLCMNPPHCSTFCSTSQATLYHQTPQQPQCFLTLQQHPTGLRLCAPAGKRELPAPLRNRFTEVWVPEPASREDLRTLVAGYLAGVTVAGAGAAGAGAPGSLGAGGAGAVDACVELYLAAKQEAVSGEGCLLALLIRPGCV